MRSEPRYLGCYKISGEFLQQCVAHPTSESILEQTFSGEGGKLPAKMRGGIECYEFEEGAASIFFDENAVESFAARWGHRAQPLPG